MVNKSCRLSASRRDKCLQIRETIELERIEILAELRNALLGARQNLRLRLDFELADLIAETRGVAVELRQVVAQAEDLLFHARARDTDFAGEIHEFVQQTGTHANLTAPFRGGTFGHLFTIRAPLDVRVERLALGYDLGCSRQVVDH